jgi:MoxR-like ATPase
VEEPEVRNEASEAPARRVRRSLLELLPGLEPAVDRLLIGYMAGGHVLLEGVPGVGKTLLARCFAKALGQSFRRVQFTPDLMPSDVTGTNVFEPREGRFRLVQGPVFTEILMADEINRTPPKTQSALLEAMQEHQVSIDGATHPLPSSFFVIATQNPLEFEGTYPLPEAQLDRFLLRARVAPPPPQAELELYRRAARGELEGWRQDALTVTPVVTPAEATTLRTASTAIHVADDLLAYLLALAEAVRASPHAELGPSPRGALSLMEAARARAALEGRDYVRPDDLRILLEACWGHRILLVAESELEGHDPGSVLEAAANQVEVPH